MQGRTGAAVCKQSDRALHGQSRARTCSDAQQAAGRQNRWLAEQARLSSWCALKAAIKAAPPRHLSQRVAPIAARRPQAAAWPSCSPLHDSAQGVVDGLEAGGRAAKQAEARRPPANCTRGGGATRTARRMPCPSNTLTRQLKLQVGVVWWQPAAGRADGAHGGVDECRRRDVMGMLVGGSTGCSVWCCSAAGPVHFKLPAWLMLLRNSSYYSTWGCSCPHLISVHRAAGAPALTTAKSSKVALTVTRSVCLRGGGVGRRCMQVSCPGVMQA